MHRFIKIISLYQVTAKFFNRVRLFARLYTLAQSLCVRRFNNLYHIFKAQSFLFGMYIFKKLSAEFNDIGTKCPQLITRHLRFFKIINVYPKSRIFQHAKIASDAAVITFKRGGNYFNRRLVMTDSDIIGKLYNSIRCSVRGKGFLRKIAGHNHTAFIIFYPVTAFFKYKHIKLFKKVLFFYLF